VAGVYSQGVFPKQNLNADMKPINEQALHAAIFQILEASEKAKSVQEIADEVKISYGDVMEHLADIGEIVQLRHETLPDGIHRVKIYRVAEEKNIKCGFPDRET
jgi:hypothetical protein